LQVVEFQLTLFNGSSWGPWGSPMQQAVAYSELKARQAAYEHCLQEPQP